MPGAASTEVREHAKRPGTNVCEQRHSSAGRAAHRAPAARRATGGLPAARAPGGRKARAATWQQEPPPRRPLPGNKRAAGSSRQARAGKCFRRLPRRPRVPGGEERLFVLGPEGGPRPPGPPRARRPAPRTPLPAAGRTPGLLRLAGPAPTAGPRRRPVSLPPPRTRPPPRFLAARARPRRDDRAAAAPTSPSPLLLRERREWGTEARNPPVPEMQRETLKEGRPARLRLRPPFCTA